MKKILVSAMLIVASAFMLEAQTPKCGHIASQEMVMLMSEMDSARISLQAYGADLEETLQGMEDEYNSKYTEYQRKQGTWTQAIRESKEQEIQGLVQRIQQFQQTAQQEMQEMQQKLYAPVFQKAQEAIKKVAKDNNLVYVFDTGSLIYYDANQSMDLTPAVKAYLKIPAEKVAPTQIPAPGESAAAKK